MRTDHTQLELSSKTNTSLWEYVVYVCEWSKACDNRKVDDNSHLLHTLLKGSRLGDFTASPSVVSPSPSCCFSHYVK